VAWDINAESSSLVLRATGAANLSMAELQFQAWQNQRLVCALEQGAADNQVQYPNDGWFKWDAIDADESETVLLAVDEASDEFEKVVQLMRDQTGLGTAQNVWQRKVTRVERVMNTSLYDHYFYFCQALKKKPRNNGSANELWVKHGTGNTDPVKICRGEAGVDKNYSKESGNMFGKATYTAEDARYSDSRGYCYDCPDGCTRQMLLCRFAAGTVAELTYGEATKELKHPPPHFDSVRGDVVPGSSFFALMSYRDYQIYPAYLVSFLK